MPKGISLHIGVDEVDPAEYRLNPTYAGWECVIVTEEYYPVSFVGDFRVGWRGPLTSCEKDAEDMLQLAKKQKFKASILKTKKATAKNVVDKIRSAAKQLGAGDTFFLTYAGHGSQVEDLSGDEWDGSDETWCLYDRMFLDDEQRALYAEFARGVKIVVLSDSCHSGSATRSGESDSLEERLHRQRKGRRAMTERTAMAIYQGNKKRYDVIQQNLANPPPKLKASRILFSACQDNEHAQGDDENGVFTRALKKVWNNGKFKGNYGDLAKQIRDELQANYNKAVDKAGGDASVVSLQVPNFVRIKGSSKAALAKFIKQRPFSL